MNINERLIYDIEQKKVFSKDELFNLVNKYSNGVSRSYFYQIISDLKRNRILAKVDTNIYSTEYKNDFSYFLTMPKVEQYIRDFGDYVIWDTNIINKWINHLLNSVTTFIEVDRDLMYLVAEKIKAVGFNHVIVNPNVNEFFKYKDNHTIVIKPLVKSLIEKNHRISIERLVIELYSNKLTKPLYGDMELLDMISEIFKTYNINFHKLFHIAKRKKIYEEFYSFILRITEMRKILYD